MNPKISIIVPVYNAEKYLQQCIDSILIQTYTNFELLLINDGSTDNSGSICNEYAQKDSRIKVFHKQNGGVSSARNLGLYNAQGEWLLFVDSDDKITSETLDLNMAYQNQHEKIDFIKYSAISKYGSSNEKLIKTKFKILNTRKSILKFFFLYGRNEVWGYFFKKQKIGTLTFHEHIKIGEDLLFLIEYINRCEKGILSDKGLYYYYLRVNSAMGNIKKYDGLIESDCILFEELKKLKIPIDILIIFSYRFYHKILKQINYRNNEKYVTLISNFINKVSFKNIIFSQLSLFAKYKFIIGKFKTFLK